VIMGVYAFNSSNIQSWPIPGFTTKWISAAWHDEQVRDALVLSLKAALLATAIALVLGSLVLRGGEPRHAEELINAAGLAILVIPLLALAAGVLQLLSLFGGFPDSVLPDFWELVVLAAGCGLVAYGAVDRVPGAAYLGVANLAAFIAVTAISPDQTLLYWPLLLLMLGAGAMLAGLRPRAPLPPEPDPYRAGEQPLAARADEEITLRVRDDSPPG
jgi:hypothetical protein